MRSTRGLIGAATVLLSYPVAIVATMLLGGDAATLIVHLFMGAGFVILASSFFDFGLPRWVNVIGVAAIGGFGAIFFLQGVADTVHIPAISYVAFDLLGGPVERVLPDVGYLWFAALLLSASQGRSRFVGWAIVPTIIGLEVGALAGIVLGTEMPVLKFLVLLPTVWLLIESIKQRPTRTMASRHGAPALAESAAS
jgi:hypothetical protein